MVEGTTLCLHIMGSDHNKFSETIFIPVTFQMLRILSDALLSNFPSRIEFMDIVGEFRFCRMRTVEAPLQ